MSPLDIHEDPTLTPSQLELIARLTKDQINEIDQAILSVAGDQYRKVAFVVGTVMGKLENSIVGIPDVFFSQRVAELVSLGKLEAQGDLKHMRYSEVKRT